MKIDMLPLYKSFKATGVSSDEARAAVEAIEQEIDRRVAEHVKEEARSLSAARRDCSLLWYVLAAIGISLALLALNVWG